MRASRCLVALFAVGILSQSAMAEDLFTPMADDLEQNRDVSAAQQLRIRGNVGWGRFELPRSTYKVTGGDRKDSGQHILLQGLYNDVSGIRFGGKLIMDTDRFAWPGITNKLERTQLSALAAKSFAPNWGLGLELASVQAKFTSGNVSASESYLKMIPSAVLVAWDTEFLLSYHPTIAINHKGIQEKGYLKVRGSRQFVQGTTLIGEITHNRYSALSPGLKDTLDFMGGARHQLYADIMATGFLIWEPSYYDNSGALAAGNPAGGIGFDAEVEWLMQAQQILGGKLRWRMASQSDGGISVKRNTYDVAFSYSKRI